MSKLFIINDKNISKEIGKVVNYIGSIEVNSTLNDTLYLKKNEIVDYLSGIGVKSDNISNILKKLKNHNLFIL